MNLQAMQLHPVMHRYATELQTLHPSVVYTSGRRDLQQQAHAMACNVVSNRQWISRTYRHAAALQTAVDYHPDSVTVPQIELLLVRTMQQMDPEELAKVSDHLAGLAVDLAPMEDGAGQLTPEGQAVYGWIFRCADTKWVTTREGGLTRWHWSVKLPIATEV